MTPLTEYKGPLPTEEEAKRILSTHKLGDPLPAWYDRYLTEVIIPFHVRLNNRIDNFISNK
jgi:hypothetical protein